MNAINGSLWVCVSLTLGCSNSSEVGQQDLDGSVEGQDDAAGDVADAASPGAKPGAGNTGVPPGVTLAPYQGSCTIDIDNTVFDAVDFDCELVIAATNVTVKRSRVRGGVLVSEHSGFLLEDSTLNAGFSISSSTDVTLRRNDIHGPGDSVHITSDGATMCEDILLEGNWIHDPEPSQEDHYDAVQVRGVQGLTLRGNNLDSGPWEFPHNAIIFLENANGGNSNVTIDGNWLNGGGYMLYISGAAVEVTNNKIGRDHNWGLLYSGQSPFTESGNTFEDTGEPVVFQ